MGTSPAHGVLVVAALHEEVAHIGADVDVLVTGVGKARAAAALAHRIASAPPRMVVNVGTAGAVLGGFTGVHEIGYVTQHDFPYAAIEGLVAHPVERGFHLTNGSPPQAVLAPPGGVVALATGDVFVADASNAARIAGGGVHLVDMEAYAYAAACAEFRVPFRCAKAVSDAADEAAGLSWLDSIDACALALGQWLRADVLGG